MAVKPKKREHDPVDIHVGGRVRLRRILLGMGQGKLGKAVGLTFQQIQKYERGSNRIGSSRLYQFSKVLQVPVSFFFDDMPEEVTGRSRGLRKPGQVAFDKGNFTKRETLELVRGYYKITDVPTRRRMFELVKAIGAAHSK